jgi:hypothetical protein
MKAKFITKTIAIVLASSILFQSCIGSFKLTNKYWTFQNTMTDNKVINAVVFWFIGHVVTCATFFVDVFILNVIEFWTDENPLAYNTQEVTNENGVKFLVETTPAGHKITNQETNEDVSFLFNEVEKSWSVQTVDGVQQLFSYVDDTHVRMSNGSVVKLSEAGLYAFKNAIENQRNFAMR